MSAYLSTTRDFLQAAPPDTPSIDDPPILFDDLEDDDQASDIALYNKLFEAHILF